jgi:hypothetical protein
VQDIFTEATRDFQASLPDDEKADYHPIRSSDEMLESVKQHIDQLQTREDSRLTRACTKINTFGKALELFFSVVDALVSTHPDWAGFFWAAVRLTFKAGVISFSGRPRCPEFLITKTDS